MEMSSYLFLEKFSRMYLVCTVT